MNGMTKSYVPKRHDIVWLDFEPKKGQEIGKYRPAFVLSSKDYNQKTGTVICCPISTSIRGSLAEVSVFNLQKKSVVVSHAGLKEEYFCKSSKRIHAFCLYG